MEISLINILLLGISLGVDIFSISLAIGGYFSVISKKETFSLVGLSMLAHLIMLLVGDLLGGFLSEYIYSFANWIIFLFLSFIGGKLIYESIKNEDEIEIKSNFFSLKNLLILTTITSLDALAVGFGFSLLNVNFLRLSLVVPIVGAMGYLGLKAGGKLSQKFPNVMKKIAGVVLILIGVAQLL